MVWVLLSLVFFMLGFLPALFAYLIYFADQPGLTPDGRRRGVLVCVWAVAILWGASIWTFAAGVL